MKTLTLRVNGFAIIVGGLIFLLGLFMLYGAVQEIFTGFNILNIVLLLLFGILLTLTAYRFFYYNKIEITSDELLVNVQEFGKGLFQFGTDSPVLPTNKKGLRQTFIPKYNQINTPLSDIQYVLIGSLKELEKSAPLINSEALNQTLRFWHQWFVNMNTAMPLWVAAQFTPVMLIKSKTGNSYVVSTKPYSKIGFKKLVQEFKKRAVPITTQKSLGLE